MSSGAPEKSDSSVHTDREDGFFDKLWGFDPNSWWITMSFSGGIGSLLIYAIFVLWLGTGVSALFLGGPLAGALVAGCLSKRYGTEHTLIGAATGLLAALPVLAIVGVLIFASQRIEPLSNSWTNVVVTGGLGLSASAGVKAMAVLILAFAITGGAGRLIGFNLASQLLSTRT